MKLICPNCKYEFEIHDRIKIPFNTPKVLICNKCNRNIKTIRDLKSNYKTEMC